MSKLDSVDQKLIGLLRSNARTAVVDLAKKLGVSRATVQNRMKRLEKEGVIRNYTINLRTSSDINPVRAFMTIAIDGKMISAVTQALKGYPEVVAIHYTNGRWDVVAEIHTSTLEAFNQLLNDIRLIDGVASTETSLLLNTLST